MKNNYEFVKFKSGFGVSIQASSRSYCDPKNNHGPYTAVELGFPTASEPLIMEYAEDRNNPTETVYGWVPAAVVTALVIKHGGVERGSMPDLDMSAEQSAILADILSMV